MLAAAKAGTKRKTASEKAAGDKRVRIDPQPSTSKNESAAVSKPDAEAQPKKSSLKKTAERAQLEPEEEEEMLQGFESSDNDGSSDEGSSDEESQPGLLAKDLPNLAGEAPVASKLSKAKQHKSKSKPGVVFIGRLPRGFEEDQLKQYFEQFGTVNRLRLSRNKKTGASKHYAFLEFAHLPVAEIVADTMNNYLLLGHILVCHVIPEENIHPRLWAGAGKKFKVMPRGRKEMHQHNAPKTAEQQDHIKKRLKKKDAAKKQQLVEAGIEYDFAGYTDSAQKSVADKSKPMATA